MPRRTQGWIWSGRIVAALVLVGLTVYLLRVGLDTANKLASSISVVIALAALLAPYLLPAPQLGGPTMSNLDHVEGSGNATATAGRLPVDVSRMRERILAAVRARVERFAAGGDPAVVLDPVALAEVTALLLLDTAADPAADLEVAHAAGWLHWYRYLVLDRGDGQQALPTALRLLAPVYRAQPDALPDQIRAYLGPARLAPPGNPEVMANCAIELLRHTLRAGGRVELDRAIDLLRRALNATPADHPDRAMYLSNLSAALQTRFGRTGDRADLDAAVTAGRDTA